MLAFIKFIQKKVSLLRDNARPHTSVSNNVATTILDGQYCRTHHNPVFVCFAIWKAACKDTIMWMKNRVNLAPVAAKAGQLV